ncbi:ASKHA domain-containing protein [Desulfocicer vacuolatum]|nr:ASKHA domain-containing protein [Desulfocicer vacuolatum]
MIIFQPSGLRGEVPLGISIMEASRQLGVDIEALCGDKQVCGKCKVRIEQGVFQRFGIESKPSHAGPWQVSEEKYIAPEEREKGYRLGCATRIKGDLLVFVPESSRAGKQVVSKAAGTIHITPDPAVKSYYIELKESTFDKPLGHFEQVCEALETQFALSSLTIDVHALQCLGHALTKGKWCITVTVWMDREIIRIRPGKATTSLGLAIDIGTTTIAAYLCDLTTMDVLTTVSGINPQCKYGEDVLSRISYHMAHAHGLDRMHDDIINTVNGLIRDAVNAVCQAKESADSPSEQLPLDSTALPQSPGVEDIEDITICGNTTMHHILLKLNPENLGAIPFAPTINHSVDIKARDLGIKINPGASIFLLPNVAGFVGGDTMGVLLARQLHTSHEIELIVDIGTNGELILGNKDTLLCSSCATGPALEGAQIEFGMRAAPGAIERVSIDPDTWEVDYKVVGQKPWKSYSKPQEMHTKGICGSGILDAVARLYMAGIIRKGGAFTKKEQKSPRLRKHPETGMPEFVLAWANETSIGKDIVITQKDVRQVQLAKAAIYTGSKIMMRKMNIDRVDKVKIAGAFGSHIDCSLALVLGMFPDCKIDEIEPVGNAAGDGCRMTLLNRSLRQEADMLVKKMQYVELTLEEGFPHHLMEATQIPHMVDAFPHLHGVVNPDILNQKK